MEGKIEDVKNMLTLALGMNIEIVVKVTGLDRGKEEKLKKQLKTQMCKPSRRKPVVLVWRTKPLENASNLEKRCFQLWP